MILSALMALAAAQPAVSIGVHPAAPVMYDVVSIEFACRGELSGDIIDQSQTRVRIIDGRVRVDIRYNPPPIPPLFSTCNQFVNLGQLPEGSYGIDVFADGALYATRQITVGPMPPAAPGQVRPRENFSGLYWNPQKPGRALDVAQDPRTHALLAVWYTYDPGQAPTFIAFQCDRWSGPTVCLGTFYRTSSAWFGNAPGTVPFTIAQIGTGGFGCPTSDTCRISGTVDGVAVQEGFTRFFKELL